MAEEQKKFSKTNKYADYGAAMAPVKGDPMAFEWQKSAEAQIAEATTPQVMFAYLKDETAAGALLAKVQGAYKTNPLTLTVIGAVSQYVMDPAGGIGPCLKLCKTPGAAPCRRKIWNLALLAAFRKTKDAYVQTFLLDQLRWCCCKARLDELKALKANAADGNVRKLIDQTVSEVEGVLQPAK